MNKKTKSSTNLPLSEVRVLVGRAKHQASQLSGELRKLGAEVIEIPLIEIRKPRSFKLLDSALRNLHTYDWLILTSVNGVEAMWERLARLRLIGTLGNFVEDPSLVSHREGRDFADSVRDTKSSAALVAEGPRRRNLRVAAIGPATKKAIEQRGVRVDVVPKEYVAESVVRSLRRRVKGKRVLLVRAKVARDVIPRELRKAGAEVDVVEAYETVVPELSRRRLRAALQDPRQRPHVITFTSSSTVRNFVALIEGSRKAPRNSRRSRGRVVHAHTNLDAIFMASIGPVTSSTLHDLGLRADIEAEEFTIPGLVKAIVRALA